MKALREDDTFIWSIGLFFGALAFEGGGIKTASAFILDSFGAILMSLLNNCRSKFASKLASLLF
jgi:hypothetical protein